MNTEEISDKVLNVAVSIIFICISILVITATVSLIVSMFK